MIMCDGCEAVYSFTGLNKHMQQKSRSLEWFTKLRLDCKNCENHLVFLQRQGFERQIDSACKKFIEEYFK